MRGGTCFGGRFLGHENISSSTTVSPVMFSGWSNRRRQDAIDYRKEENRILRERLGGKRLRLNDDQWRRLAMKGKASGRKGLDGIAGIVTPDTILRWYRKLVGRK